MKSDQGFCRDCSDPSNIQAFAKGKRLKGLTACPGCGTLYMFFARIAKPEPLKSKSGESMADYQFLERFCKYTILAFQSKKELDSCEEMISKYQVALEACLEEEDDVYYLIRDERIMSAISLSHGEDRSLNNTLVTGLGSFPVDWKGKIRQLPALGSPQPMIDRLVARFFGLFE